LQGALQFVHHVDCPRGESRLQHAQGRRVTWASAHGRIRGSVLDVVAADVVVRFWGVIIIRETNLKDFGRELHYGTKCKKTYVVQTSNAAL